MSSIERDSRVFFDVDGSISSPRFRKAKKLRNGDGSDRPSGRDKRTETERDKDRVAYSHAFQRLAGVSQISSPSLSHPERHSRMLHSLKVSYLAREIATDLIRKAHKDPETLSLILRMGGIDLAACETAGLSHDLGHAPFGHAAERYLDRWVLDAGGKENDGFEGNAQTVRMLTRLERRNSAEPINLTNAALAAVLKYPFCRRDGSHKFGVYQADESEFHVLDRLNAIRPPFVPADTPSLEAQIMDIADDITYAVHDLEDYYQAGVLDLRSLRQDLNKCISVIDQHKFEAGDAGSLDLIPGLFIEDMVDERATHRMTPRAYADALLLTARWMEWDTGFSDTFLGRGLSREDFAALVGRLVTSIQLKRCGRGTKVVMDESNRNLLYVLQFIGKVIVIDSPKVALHENAQVKVVEVLCGGLLDLVKRVGDDRPVRTYRLPPELGDLLGAGLKDGRLDEFSRRRAIADYLCTLTDSQCVDIANWLGGHAIPEI